MHVGVEISMLRIKFLYTNIIYLCEKEWMHNYFYCVYWFIGVI